MKSLLEGLLGVSGQSLCSSESLKRILADCEREGGSLHEKSKRFYLAVLELNGKAPPGAVEWAALVVDRLAEEGYQLARALGAAEMRLLNAVCVAGELERRAERFEDLARRLAPEATGATGCEGALLDEVGRLVRVVGDLEQRLKFAETVLLQHDAGILLRCGLGGDAVGAAEGLPLVVRLQLVGVVVVLRARRPRGFGAEAVARSPWSSLW